MLKIMGTTYFATTYHHPPWWWMVVDGGRWWQVLVTPLKLVKIKEQSFSGVP